MRQRQQRSARSGGRSAGSLGVVLCLSLAVTFHAFTIETARGALPRHVRQKLKRTDSRDARVAAVPQDAAGNAADALGGIAAAPVNDDCANATTVTDGATPFSTMDATTDGPAEPLTPGCQESFFDQVASDIWYSYAATCNGEVTISLCDSDYDTKLAVYDICNRCSLLPSALVCNDDALQVCGSNRSQVTFPTQQGVCYTIRVGGFENFRGTGTMNISCGLPTGACCNAGSCVGTMTEAACTSAGGVWNAGESCPAFACPVPPPTNDLCAGAIEVFTSIAFDGSTVGATGSQASSCSVGDTNDVWHKWVADCTGPATFSLCGSAFDTTISVFDACGGAELGCNDDAPGCGTASQVDVPVVQGQTYWIRVSGFGGAVGSYRLVAQSCSQEPRACCGQNNNQIVCVLTSPAQCVAFGGTSQAPGSVCLGDADANGIDDACELPADPWVWLDFNGGTPGGYLPDFDQNQDFDNLDGDNDPTTGVDVFHGGPAAVADALVWMNGRYPTVGVVAPSVTPRMLIDDLAQRMSTNGATQSAFAHPTPYAGTFSDDLAVGAQAYLNDAIGAERASVRSVSDPVFDAIATPIADGSNVVVRLGFHRIEGVDAIPGTGFVVRWRRIGGQYASVAGVNPKTVQMAISDPDDDRAETGSAGEARGGDHNHDGDATPATTLPFRDAAYDHGVHDDAALASHDAYDLPPTFGSTGTLLIADAGDALAYGARQSGLHAADSGGAFDLADSFVALAFLADNGFADPAVGQVYTVVEEALIIEPAAASGCCLSGGSCLDVSPIACVDQGGTPRIAGSVCLGDGNGNSMDDLCEPCPTATIVDVTPLDGTVDARQPSSPTNPLPRLGIGSAGGNGSVAEPIRVTLDPPVVGATHCFSLCETQSDPYLGGNDISTVASVAAGVYDITLHHAIAPDAVTTIGYEGDAGPSVAYTRHPANVDAGASASGDDLIELAACCLRGTCVPAWGSHSCDLDRSGLSTPTDLLRAADVLNGAGVFTNWDGTPLPTATGCP